MVREDLDRCVVELKLCLAELREETIRDIEGLYLNLYTLLIFSYYGNFGRNV